MTLSEREARQIILTRHGLNQGTRYANAPSAMRALVAIQTQYPASLAPALAARAEKVTANSVEQALNKTKLFLKGWNLRCTVHTSLANDHLMLLAAIGPSLAGKYFRWIERCGIDRPKLEELHGQIMQELSEGPLGRKELHHRIEFFKGLPMVGWGLDAMGLALEGKVVFAHQAAAKTEFARLDTWAPHVFACELTEREALKELIRRYFATYGPATTSDFYYWTGIAMSRISGPFKEVRDELTEVAVEGRKGSYFIFGAPPPSANFAVRLLPKFDPLVMGHRDKSLFTPDKLKEMVFRPAGQVEAVVIAEGQVRAGWRTVRKGKILEFNVEPFGKMKKTWVLGIAREASRTGKSLGFKEIDISIKDS